MESSPSASTPDQSAAMQETIAPSGSEKAEHIDSKDGDEGAEAPECPFCTYMRAGGCGAEFDSFMECGGQAEKGDVAYEDCYALFEAMRDCMKRNESSYSQMMEDLETVPNKRDSGGSPTASPVGAGASEGTAPAEPSSTTAHPVTEPSTDSQQPPS